MRLCAGRALVLTLRSSLNRLWRDARRLQAQAQRRLKTPSESEPGTVAAGRIANAGEMEKLYSGLPDRALRDAVETSIRNIPLSKHSLTRFSMYARLSDRLAAHDGLSRKCLSI